MQIIGHPVQVFKRDNVSQKFDLDQSALQSVLLHPKAKNTPVAVISISGDYRKGKSFIMNLILRHLAWEERRNSPSSEIGEDDDSLGARDEPLVGFPWRPGTQRITSGVWMWSEPFVIDWNENSSSKDKPIRRMAVLLMDTEGAFEEDSTLNDSAMIFAFALLQSSILIYNVHRNLQEDNLQILQTFTEFGRLVVDDNDQYLHNSEPPFQRLLFLVRDWFSPSDYPYGETGGHEFLQRRFFGKLQPKFNKVNELSLCETVSSESGSGGSTVSKKPTTLRTNIEEKNIHVRQYLIRCFRKTDCFLLPYPGRAVAASRDSDGSWSKWDEDFTQSVRELLHFLRNRLEPVQAFCQTSFSNTENDQTRLFHGKPLVTGSLLLRRIVLLTEKLLQNGVKAVPLYQAIAEISHIECVYEISEQYRLEMSQQFGINQPYIFPVEMDQKEFSIRKRILHEYDQTRRFGSMQLGPVYRVQLISILDDMYRGFRQRNDQKGRLGSPMFFLLALIYAIFLHFIMILCQMCGLNVVSLLPQFLKHVVCLLVVFRITRIFWRDVPLRSTLESLESPLAYLHLWLLDRLLKWQGISQ